MKPVIATLLLLTASLAHAQGPIDPSGHWKGTIEIPNRPTDFEVDLAKNARGEVVGTLTSADRSTIPLLNVTVDGRNVKFYGRADQPFEAEVTGTAMAGTATLSGYALSFSMSRIGDATIDPPPTSRAVTKELAGVWKGSLTAEGTQYHLILTIANQPDGTALAHIVSVDEGGMMLAVRVSQDGSKIAIEARGARVSFAGTLNADGSELTGTWTQEAASLPLTMRR